MSRRSIHLFFFRASCSKNRIKIKQENGSCRAAGGGLQIPFCFVRWFGLGPLDCKSKRSQWFNSTHERERDWTKENASETRRESQIGIMPLTFPISVLESVKWPNRGNFTSRLKQPKPCLWMPAFSYEMQSKFFPMLLPKCQCTDLISLLLLAPDIDNATCSLTRFVLAKRRTLISACLMKKEKSI